MWYSLKDWKLGGYNIKADSEKSLCLDKIDGMSKLIEWLTIRPKIYVLFDIFETKQYSFWII